MEKKIYIEEDYLYLPICKEQETRCFEIFCAGESGEKKLFEFLIPVGAVRDKTYPADYYARFPVKQFTDKTLILKGELPEEFFDAVENAPMRKAAELRHPSIHFTVETGWMNDPNGLVYQDGVYHLYFQYNPFDTRWGNMSWGHAVSSDLLHWEQKDAVLFPDETGMMFSGSGIVNERGMLDLPPEALMFFYTAAGDTNRWSEGKQFTQRVAYSLDGGKTLRKSDRGVLPTVCRENRDPKVFWHEESGAYIMVLWLKENDFGIFRSEDLENWTQSDCLTLERAFECPDLVRLYDEQGNAHWMFWCADGYYFFGTFDGYHFRTDGVRHEAYMNDVPYAAQTYTGVNGRVIQIPWLRLPNSGRCYTGAMGIPRELGVRVQGGKKCLTLNPVRELAAWEKSQKAPHMEYEDGICRWQIEGMEVSYDRNSGTFRVGTKACTLRPGIEDFSFLIDDVIFEVTADCGTIVGVFELEDTGRR